MSSVPPSPALTHRSAHLQLYLCGCSMSMRVGLGGRRYYRGDCENRRWHFHRADLCLRERGPIGGAVMRSPGKAAGGPISVVHLKQRDENLGGVTNRLRGLVNTLCTGDFKVFSQTTWEIMNICLLHNIRSPHAANYLEFGSYLTFLSYLLKGKNMFARG